MCGVGAILYLNRQHLIKLKFAVGPGTIKQAKLDAMWLLLKKTINSDVSKLQVFGEEVDNSLVKSYMHIKQPIVGSQIMSKFLQVKVGFEDMPFAHVDREFNILESRLIN